MKQESASLNNTIKSFSTYLFIVIFVLVLFIIVFLFIVIIIFCIVNVFSLFAVEKTRDVAPYIPGSCLLLPLPLSALVACGLVGSTAAAAFAETAELVLRTKQGQIVTFGGED